MVYDGFATFQIATFELAKRSLNVRGKVQNVHPRRGKLKRTRNVLKAYFLRAIKGIFSVFYRKYI